MSRENWQHFMHAGHFCAAPDCRYFKHTHVGNFCVSSIGDYYPRGASERQEIGLNRTFETMVFRVLEDGSICLTELAMEPANGRSSCAMNHDRLCEAVDESPEIFEAKYQQVLNWRKEYEQWATEPTE